MLFRSIFFPDEPARILIAKNGSRNGSGSSKIEVQRIGGSVSGVGSNTDQETIGTSIVVSSRSHQKQGYLVVELE